MPWGSVAPSDRRRDAGGALRLALGHDARGLVLAVTGETRPRLGLIALRLTVDGEPVTLSIPSHDLGRTFDACFPPDDDGA